jgi:hypothetical protein
MKWNIEYECTENEFVNWTNVFGSIINKMIDAKTLRRATIKAANAFTDELSDDLPTAKPMPFVVDGGLDEDSEESFTEEPTPEPIFPEVNLTSHQQKGKMELTEILNTWVINFDTEDEDAEQPDRGDLIYLLGNDGSRAGQVISYCMAVGGLTKAIWNISWEIFMSGNYDDHFERVLIDQCGDIGSLSDKVDTIAVRKIAGNITQISSIHLGHLADQFEYPNPLNQLNY